MPINYPYIDRSKSGMAAIGCGVNSDHTWFVRSEGIGKGRSNDSHYLIANEWVAGRIGQFLGLPVPPFVVVQKKSRSTAMFVSYRVEEETTPDDLIPERLYKAFPFECAGTVVFDIFIANSDRHSGNIKVDNPLFPRKFHIIDHERALLGSFNGHGVHQLNQASGRLGITGSSPSHNETHCLISSLCSHKDLMEWVSRIQDIPDWFIGAICEEVYRCPLNRVECDNTKSFLMSRRDTLHELLHSHRDRFENVPRDDWGLFS